MSTFTAAERDTILAALRLWQVSGIRPLDHVGQARRQLILNIAEENGAALTATEIDDLCERINCGEGDDARKTALATVVDAAESYAEDLSTGLADGTYEEGADKLKEIEAAIHLLSHGAVPDLEPPPPPELSECCHAEIGYDAWVNSNGVLNGGPFDHSICTNCGLHGPTAWDGKSPAWPRSEREGNVDLPEGVDEPPEPVSEVTP